MLILFSVQRPPFLQNTKGVGEDDEDDGLKTDEFRLQRFGGS
jgi:hypothetical protein